MPLADAIRAELARSDEEILKSIGQALGRGAISGDPIGRAKEFIANITDQLRDAICSRTLIRLLYEEKADAMLIVAAIADATTSLLVALSIPISPTTFAVLLFRSGVSELCSQVWNRKHA